MTFRDGYCGTDDLLIGNIPLPTWMTREQVVAAAADEMDSKLGFVYEIPIVIPDVADPSAPIPPAVRLFLKRINAALASGRTILQLDVAGENERLHAYGLSLVQEANEALDQILTGQIVLDNVPTVTPDQQLQNGPLISNVDPESSVEAFYDRIANPYFVMPNQDVGVPRGDGSWPPRGLVGGR